MTVSQLTGRIGQTVLVTFESVKVQAVITDAKASYGRVRYLIQPTAGEGSQWVEEARIEAARKPLPEWVQDRLQADEAEILRARGGK